MTIRVYSRAHVIQTSHDEDSSLRSYLIFPLHSKHTFAAFNCLVRIYCLPTPSVAIPFILGFGRFITRENESE